VQSDYAHDVLFVGGAEPDWAAFMREFMRHGSPVLLAGAYWDRYPAFRAYALGIKPPEIVRALMAAAKVNLCLVRRANRDGLTSIAISLDQKLKRLFIFATPRRQPSALVRCFATLPNVSAFPCACSVASAVLTPMRIDSGRSSHREW